MLEFHSHHHRTLYRQGCAALFYVYFYYGSKLITLSKYPRHEKSIYHFENGLQMTADERYERVHYI